MSKISMLVTTLVSKVGMKQLKREIDAIICKAQQVAVEAWLERERILGQLNGDHPPWGCEQ